MLCPINLFCDNYCVHNIRQRKFFLKKNKFNPNNYIVIIWYLFKSILISIYKNYYTQRLDTWFRRIDEKKLLVKTGNCSTRVTKSHFRRLILFGNATVKTSKLKPTHRHSMWCLSSWFSMWKIPYLSLKPVIISLFPAYLFVFYRNWN
jgi:hypothetical protein